MLLMYCRTWASPSARLLSHLGAVSMRWPLHAVFGFVCFFQIVLFDMSTRSLPRYLSRSFSSWEGQQVLWSLEAAALACRDGGHAGVQALPLIRGSQKHSKQDLAMNEEQRLRNAVASLPQTCWIALLLWKPAVICQLQEAQAL